MDKMFESSFRYYVSSFRHADTIQRASVFLSFSPRPETLLKSSSTFRAEERASSEPFKIRVVSSAYWLILVSLLLREIPFMLTLFLTALAKSSTKRINRYGDTGQPCLTLLRVWKKLVDQPLFRTQLSVFALKNFYPDKGPLQRIKSFFKVCKN